MNDKIKSYKQINSVKKALEILEYLSRQRRPVTAREITDAVSMPQATVMSHLTTLRDTGYVAITGEQFTLGLAAAALWADYKNSLLSQKADITTRLERIGG